MKKFIAVCMTAVMCAALFAGCSKKEQETPAAPEESAAVQESAKDSGSADAAQDAVVRIGALKGPTAMGMVALMDESDQGSANGSYKFSIHGAVDEMSPLLVQGKLDIAALPANLASVLYNNTDEQVRVLAVNTLGVLYLVEKGDTIQSAADLKGRTIYASGKGATPEYCLNYILRENGIDPAKDVTIEYKSEHTECVAALANNPEGVAMLPQPFVTIAMSKDPSIRVALDLTKEWDRLQEGDDARSSLLTGVVVARTEFLESNPEAVNTFLDEYKASVEFVNANVDEAAKLVGSYDIVPEEVAKKALPECNITFMEGTEMKEALSGYLSVLMEQNPQAVGGALPDDAFYYVR